MKKKHGLIITVISSLIVFFVIFGILEGAFGEGALRIVVIILLVVFQVGLMAFNSAANKKDRT